MLSSNTQKNMSPTIFKTKKNMKNIMKLLAENPGGESYSWFLYNEHMVLKEKRKACLFDWEREQAI